MRRLWQSGAIGAALLALAAPASADPALDWVRSIYAGLVDGSAPGGLSAYAGPEQRRRYMTERLAAVFDANDAQTEEPCIDFAPEIDAQDYDGLELGETLTLAASPGAAGAETVTAGFRLFGEPAQVIWSFVPVDGRLLLDDITGASGSLAAVDCGLH